MRFLAALTSLILSVAAFEQARAAELVMFEEAGCGWCERWNDEIGTAYSKTEEGRLAPLRRVSLEAPRPDDLAGVRSVTFSPTFLVMQDGKEYGRIVGYPGQDFFWPMLQEILSTLPDTGGAKAHVGEVEKNDAIAGS